LTPVVVDEGRIGDVALDAVVRRLGGGDALGALEAVVRARAGLDQLERQAVAGMREGGSSWADVGRVLGVTKQAAQQRYGPPATPWRRQPRQGVADQVDGAELRCAFSDSGRDYCLGRATVRRGSTPLCESCEQASSSLKRQPLRRV
jgi:hypothetical protein